MKNRLRILVMMGLLILMAVSDPAAAQKKIPDILPDTPWSFLSTSATHAYQFIKAHPSYDGRGVVVIVCDSGVDVDTQGLLQTSTGQKKIIDVQDFSGEGDVKLTKAKTGEENGEKYVENSSGRRLYIGNKPALTPVDSVYWIGFLDESKYKNSGVPDFNNNGSRNDKFGVVAFKVKKDGKTYWVAYVDTNADGRLDDEKPVRDYRVNYDVIHLRGRNVAKKPELMSFALNIRPEKKIASFFFADNAHGTHVSGIIAGYRINGEPTLNGIAPGAQIIALKIGNNTLAGGSTTSGSMKKAYEYGVKWAKDHPDKAVVFNMSYGIGSEIEGKSAIDQFIDRILKENENIAICLSNGNDGPGISTTGTPAASFWAISSGALMPWRSARDSYSAGIKRDVILPFSSRGGEIAKPDVLSPGAAMSSVPPYARSENFWGTSMASPQTAGAVALLMSAAKQQKPPIPIRGALIKRTLKFGADWLPAYTALDQGGGVVNIRKSFEILKKYAGRHEEKQLLDYKITTKSPIFPDDHGPTAYWRAGGYFPHGSDRQIFRVKAIFPKDKKPDAIEHFYRAFNLKPDVPWLIVNKKSTYIRADESATIPVSYDASKLSKPGLYVGKVVAYLKNGRGNKRIKSNTEFELWNTIVVPYTFSDYNQYKLRFQREALEPGMIKRYFLEVPPGASGCLIRMRPSQNKWSRVRMQIFDPMGRKYASTGYASSKISNTVTISVLGEDLAAGIWELVTISDFRNPKTSFYDLNLNFSGFALQPELIKNFAYKMGGQPKGTFTVTNRFNRLFQGFATGQILGFKKVSDKKSTGKDRIRIPFKIDKSIKMVQFKIRMSPEDFNKFTDIATNIYDSGGRAVVQNGLSYDRLTLYFMNPKPGTYTLEVWAAYTNPAKKSPWKFKLTENYFVKNPISVSCKKAGGGSLFLYPDMPQKMEFTLNRSPELPPEGTYLFGKILFQDSKNRRPAAVLPIRLEAKLVE
ncbi:serine protease AprX [bacterium BMS3Abin05]|nr:serine protease AprX [bacterium BMS3Abin05]GBE27488.1 serine protease AprX [bacterium BMS3Bbin03]